MPAISINGEQITLINPTLTNPDPTNSNGIRVTGGTGFRCYGGSVESGGGGALQFANGPNSGDISDGAYIGTRASSQNGRVLLVDTAFGSIDNVRFIGVTGTSTTGQLIAVQRRTQGNSPGTARSVTNVLFRGVTLTQLGPNTDPSDGILVSDQCTSSGRIAGVDFENVVAVAANGANVLRIVSDPGSPSAPVAPWPITHVRWRGGRLSCSSPDQPAVQLNRVEGATFEAMRIETNTILAGQPMIAIGTITPCANVAFSDVSMTGLRAGQTGIAFNKASACGWQRGVMSGNATALPASFGAQSQGCYLLGANVSGISPNATIDPLVTAFRIGDNHGSGQRSPISLGAAVVAQLATQAADVSSSSIRLKPSPSTALSTLVGGAVGDLLVVGKDPASGSITVNDKGTTGNLQLSGNFSLTNDGDTLLVQRRSATDWVELAESTNG